jgi:hypothetical protein
MQEKETEEGGLVEMAAQVELERAEVAEHLL